MIGFISCGIMVNILRPKECQGKWTQLLNITLPFRHWIKLSAGMLISRFVDVHNVFSSVKVSLLAPSQSTQTSQTQTFIYAEYFLVWIFKSSKIIMDPFPEGCDEHLNLYICIWTNTLFEYIYMMVESALITLIKQTCRLNVVSVPV